jgi:hypothetical protein
MITALKIIGLVLLGIVILILVGFLLLRWAWRRLIRKGTELQRVIPCRVTLEPEANPQWHDARAIGRMGAELRALGFQDIGSFQIPEMEGLLVQALHHPQEPAYAIVYDHRKIPATMDLVRGFTDEFGLSVASTAMGSTLDQRADSKTYWMDQASAREMFDTLKGHQHSAPAKPHPPGDFAARFRESYTKSMNWRMRKGGVSRDEMRRQAKSTDISLTDEQFEEAWKEQRDQYRRQMQAACIAQFLDDTKPSAADWERRAHRAVVIAETFDRQDIVEVLDGHLMLDEEQRHRLEKFETQFGESGLDLVQRLLTQDAAGLKLIRHGEVSEPVRAFILLTPDSEEEAVDA